MPVYELLTSETPFDRQRLRAAAFDELLRIIREEEPPRPSIRLSSSHSLPSIAANRHIEPKKLSALVRGELDWIVMKALEKERSRRYETANGFANDIQRYLNDEPVVACPPSAAYRFRKFVRRNKGPVAAVSLVLLALVAGMIGTTWGLVRADNARRDAVAAQVAEAARAAGERRAREEAQAREAETRAVLDFVENRVFATVIAATNKLTIQGNGDTIARSAGSRDDWGRQPAEDFQGHNARLGRRNERRQPSNVEDTGHQDGHRHNGQRLQQQFRAHRVNCGGRSAGNQDAAGHHLSRRQHQSNFCIEETSYALSKPTQHSTAGNSATFSC